MFSKNYIKRQEMPDYGYKRQRKTVCMIGAYVLSVKKINQRFPRK